MILQEKFIKNNRTKTDTGGQVVYTKALRELY